MKHVRLALDAGGREADVHPVYDVHVNAPYVEQSTAMHWSFDGDALGIMHHVVGDREAFAAAMDRIDVVVDYELVPAGDNAFYAYIRDSMTQPLREVFEIVTETTAVVVPPIEYDADGTVSYSVFGPAREIQAAIDRIPEPIEVTVTEIGGMDAIPGLESVLSERQREAIETALSLGYYDIPREASHEDVATALECAPSTAAEHLRKAEAKLLRSVVGD